MKNATASLLKSIAKRFLAYVYYGLPSAKSLQLKPTPGGTWVFRVHQHSILIPQVCSTDLAAYPQSDPAFIREWEVFSQLARQPGLFFDIGGHIGLFSALFCRFSANHQADCFEPSPLVQPITRDVRGINSLEGLWQIHSLAIGEKAGTMNMLLDPVGGFVQVQEFSHSMLGQPQTIELPIITIDQFVDSHKRLPRLLKIDIEGYEWEALQGASQTLARHGPDILLELHLSYLKARGISPVEVIRLLKKAGYQTWFLSMRPVTELSLQVCPLSRVHVLAQKAKHPLHSIGRRLQGVH